MDHPLLRKRIRGLRAAPIALRAAVLFAVPWLLCACIPFDDPLEEIDPALIFDYLTAAENFPVARGHILESFGAYGCASCPDAEGRLSPYLDEASPAHNPRLFIVNYHVAFPSTLEDPWITAGTQARHDAFGFTSLPQVKLNGSNAPYGIREKDVRFAQGEYDSLIRRARRVDSLTYIDFRIDTAASGYDSAARRMEVRFTVLNRATSAQGALSFRVLAVKNRSVTIPILPNHPWEVIVAETTERDTMAALMALSGMPALSAKTWVARLQIPLESERDPAPSDPENPAGYALIVFAKNAAGVVLSASGWRFSPE
jgi:hypothetical protein